jgi:hypothetical protein
VSKQIMPSARNSRLWSINPSTITRKNDSIMMNNMDESRKRNCSSSICIAPGSSNDAPDDAAFPDAPSTLAMTMPPESDSDDLRRVKHQRLDSTTASPDEHQVNEVSPNDAKSTLMHKESSVSSSNSGSGTDDLCGGATSSSGNPGVVTASTAPNHNASSLSGDDRSSSESAQGSANTGESRAGRGEANTAKQYYTGYGHGLSNVDNTSSFHQTAQHCDVKASHFSNNAGANHPLSVTSLAAAHDVAQQQLHRHTQQKHATNNKTARHVVVSTDKGGTHPSHLILASHMRHHSRQYHHNPQSPLTNAASATLHDIPFAIGGPAEVRHHRYRNMNQNPEQHVSIMPNHYDLRLPQSDEQAVLQRVPRTHATVVAHDLPPPPNTSDAWSSSASSGSSSRSRRRTSAIASAGHSQERTVESTCSNKYSQPMFDSPQALVDQQNCTGQSSTSDDSSEGAKSETDAVGSGSDEGYAASSERQSGSGSGSDSTSSDYSKKGRGPGRCGGGVSLLKVGVTTASRSDSKRTETSSMSSSVLADYSSGMNDELSRTDSPRSSSTSLSSNGGNDIDGANKAASKMAKAGCKRDLSRLNSSVSDKARKKWKNESNAKYSATDGFGPAANAMKSGLSIMEKVLQQKARSTNHHHYHSRSTGRKMLEKSFLSAKRDLSTADAASAALASSKQCAEIFREGQSIESPDFQMGGVLPYDEASIYSLGQDVMAQVVAFLEPPEIQSFLTTPLSKSWLVAYTEPQGLWKILCTSKPFYAKLDESESEASDCSFPMCNDMEMRHLFGRYRLLYTSFVRCMKYLNRLQDDALNGRAPTLDVNSNQNDIYPFNRNASLKAYFAKARRLMRSSSRKSGSRSSSDAALSITSESGSQGSDEKVVADEPMSRATESRKIASTNGASKQGHPTRQLGRSMLTDRLLRPARGGSVDNINLPWSCAIYSVVNWMVAFADVEGIQVRKHIALPLLTLCFLLALIPSIFFIQIMCLKCLPYLLEDESQRTTAQRAGLTDSVLRAMVLFPDSIELHTVAFHTLVLLARPLGGNEGMLFHTAMVNTRGIFNNGSSNSKNGIVIMLDSMKRFSQDEILQAMSCWSLVNVALTPLQKSMLVKLGGLTVTSNAMLQHPYNVEVQFRALFALINLVIPSKLYLFHQCLLESYFIH